MQHCTDSLPFTAEKVTNPINKPVRSDSVYSVLRLKGGANECCICNKIIEPSKKFTKITEGLDETF